MRLCIKFFLLINSKERGYLSLWIHRIFLWIYIPTGRRVGRKSLRLSKKWKRQLCNFRCHTARCISIHTILTKVISTVTSSPNRNVRDTQRPCCESRCLDWKGFCWHLYFELSFNLGPHRFRLGGWVALKQKFICWNLTPHEMVLGSGVCGWWLGRESFAFVNGLSALRKQPPERAALHFPPCEDGQKVPPVIQSVDPQVPDLTVPWSQTPRPLELWATNFLCFKATRSMVFRRAAHTKAGPCTFS